MKLVTLVEVLNIKLIETLREELGSAYTVSANGGLSKNPYNSYSISISAPCGPENVDKIIKATLAEIKKIQDKGPTELDLNKVKETTTKKYREDVKDNGYWLNRLQRNSEFGSDPGLILTVESRLMKVTAKDVQDAAKKYFN